MIRRALLSLTRVAVGWSDGGKCAGPRFLRRISERVSRVAGEEICLGYSAEKRGATMGGLAGGLRPQSQPVLEVRRYSPGFTSARVRLVVQPGVGAADLVELWRMSARAAEPVVDGALRGEGMLSRPYAMVHVIEGGPIEDLPPEVLYGLSAPLMRGEVSRKFAESRSKRDWGMRPGGLWTSSGPAPSVKMWRGRSEPG